MREWNDDELRRIANAIGASRQALLLRFVTIKRASWDHYHKWVKIFDEERRKADEDAS